MTLIQLFRFNRLTLHVNGTTGSQGVNSSLWDALHLSFISAALGYSTISSAVAGLHSHWAPIHVLKIKMKYFKSRVVIN